MRMAALRALKSVKSAPGNRLELDFDADPDLLTRAASWLAS